MENKNIYLVIGTIWESGSLESFNHTVVNDYCVHSTLEGAQKELYRILEETVRDAKTHGVTLQTTLTDTKLEVIWTETGAEEQWLIHEREIDKQI